VLDSRVSHLAEPSESFDVVLTARRDAGAGTYLVTLTPPPDRARAYQSPGQYIKIHAQSGGYFVLAGEVEAPSWELLVRNSGGAADSLANDPEGTSLETSGPFGNGFALDKAKGRPLVLAVVGSALAVARPIVRERIAQREIASTTIYIGARTPKDVPLEGEVAGWVRAGARLVLCLSKTQEASDEKSMFPTALHAPGWVQHVLADDLRKNGFVPHTLIFAAGPLTMLDEVRALGGGTTGLEVITNV
jgi:NAD(P)H-flavin reductase